MKSPSVWDGSGRDPHEEHFRRRRHILLGRTAPRCGTKETLVKATEAIDWGKTTTAAKARRKDRQRLRCIQKPTRSPTTSNAGVMVNSKGEVTVLAGTVEIGQGCNTILSQVAAEELKVPMEKVFMHPLDTDVIPYDASTTSSRSTYHMGNAVRRAAIHARQQSWRRRLRCSKPTSGSRLCRRQSISQRPAADGFADRRMCRKELGINGVVRGDGSYTYEIGKDLDLETGHSDHASAFYMYATQAAEVARR